MHVVILTALLGLFGVNACKNCAMSREFMRISHISTTHKGGAGIAARNLNSNLTSRSIDSKFLALEQADFSMGLNEISVSRSFFERARSGIYGNVQNRLSKKSFFSLASYSPASASRRITVESKSRILHIHNWYNITNLSEIAKLIDNGAKVVITLHDERLYTGGCHSTLGCNKFQTFCDSCPGLASIFRSFPSRNLKVAEENFESLFSEATFIAPSKWIMKQAKASKLLYKSRIEFIPNVIKPPTQEISSYNEKEGIRLGFAAIDPTSYIKGGVFFQKATDFSLRNPSQLKIVKMSDFTKNTDLFWGAIDFLCVPSNADNSPNVIHEAKLLGVPVLATQVGGIPELLDKNFDIELESPEAELDGVLSGMKKSLQLLENRESRRLSISAFNKLVGSALDEHIVLYSEILESH